jgi:L-fuconolactonase
MTNTPVVDSHHHFWDPTRREYYWMESDELASIRKPIGPADLRPLLAQNKVDRTVIVQTVPSVEETEEFLSIAADTDFVAGVVGWVDLSDPGVSDTLAELKAGANGKYLVGIRHQVHDEEDPAWVAREDVIRGIKAVGAAGLAYDLLPKQRELPACLPAVDAKPDMRFVVDHIAKPLIAAGEMEPWATRLEELAKRPNVYCKLSGMVTEADWTGWKPEDLKPYVDRVLEWFGEDRVMFGSDWPVCLLASDYGTVKDTLESLLGNPEGATYAKIFGGNATSFYGLK